MWLLLWIVKGTTCACWREVVEKLMLLASITIVLRSYLESVWIVYILSASKPKQLLTTFGVFG